MKDRVLMHELDGNENHVDWIFEMGYRLAGLCSLDSYRLFCELAG